MKIKLHLNSTFSADGAGSAVQKAYDDFKQISQKIADRIPLTWSEGRQQQFSISEGHLSSSGSLKKGNLRGT
ncbi:MAG: hypothetical protein ACRC8A_02030 [Microcoleaceae cyanobacterium]